MTLRGDAVLLPDRRGCAGSATRFRGHVDIAPVFRGRFAAFSWSWRSVWRSTVAAPTALAEKAVPTAHCQRSEPHGAGDPGYSQSLRLNKKYNPTEPTTMSRDETMRPEVLAKPGYGRF